MDKNQSPVPLPEFGLAEDILRAHAPVVSSRPQTPAPRASLQSQVVAPGPGLLEFLQSLPAASSRGAVEAVEPPVQLVSIELAGELYGIPIEMVQEVLRVGSITRVPGAPAPLLGITGVRGKILPVLDLRARLGLPQSPLDRKSRIIVVEILGRLLGLLVDAVHQVMPLARSLVEPPPQGSELVGGVAQLAPGRLIILLELDRLLERS